MVRGLNLVSLYNFAVAPFLANSLKSFLNIFPDGLLGMTSINTTPPLNCLKSATFAFTNALTSSSVRSPPLTTYARGTSVPGISTPITAASRILGCVKRRASSSAGATCRPLYLMSSFCCQIMFTFLQLKLEDIPSFGLQYMVGHSSI